MLGELFNDLLVDGVEFHYHDEKIPYSQIIRIEIDLKNNITLELENEDLHTVTVNDFKDNHSKEGINYHHWSKVRDFDSILEDKSY